MCSNLRDHHLKIIISKICMNIILSIKQKPIMTIHTQSKGIQT